MTQFRLPLCVLLACVAYLLIGYALVRMGRERARRRDEAWFQTSSRKLADEADLEQGEFLLIVTVVVMAGWPAFLCYWIKSKIERRL